MPGLWELPGTGAYIPCPFSAWRRGHLGVPARVALLSGTEW